MQEERKEFRQKINAGLSYIDQKIDDLMTSAQGAGSGVAADFSEALDDLRARRAGAADKLRTLKDASDDSWRELKVGVQSAWDELEEAADDLGLGLKKAVAALRTKGDQNEDGQ